jgi:hypothetical protein
LRNRSAPLLDTRGQGPLPVAPSGSPAAHQRLRSRLWALEIGSVARCALLCSLCSVHLFQNPPAPPCSRPNLTCALAQPVSPSRSQSRLLIARISIHHRRAGPQHRVLPPIEFSRQRRRSGKVGARVPLVRHPSLPCAASCIRHELPDLANACATLRGSGREHPSS